MNILEQVKRSNLPLESTVQTDNATSLASKAFDYQFDGTSKFYQWDKPKNIPQEFNLGVIVGASGSGKSTLLCKFGQEETPVWDENLAIVSQFGTPEEALDKLSAVGLNSIPAWVKPYHVLSTGERFRADLARKLKDNAVIDEYSSVVDRTVAKASSVALSKYIKKTNMKNIVLSTCHEDVLEWLQPDWVFDTNTGILYDGRSLRRPIINLEFRQCHRSWWELFKDHHYLTESINKSARCYLVTWDGIPVAFSSSIPMPSGTLKNAWRGHRTVVLPDYQGMGIGTRVSNTMGEIHLEQGYRYFSRTAHPRLGLYRENSLLWKPTSKNMKLRKDVKNGEKNYTFMFYDNTRICFSHEYIGGKVDDSSQQNGK